MKINKLICTISAAVLLASCGTAKNYSHETYREISDFSNICFTDTITGEFYYDDNDATHFIDYTTMSDTLLCPKPNCLHTPNHTHDDPECPAYDLGFKPCLYGKNLYFMTDNGKMTNNGYVPCINMRRADIDGTNRKIVAELEGYRTSGENDYLVGDKLYFVAAYRKDDSGKITLENGSVAYDECGIWCYDFPTNTFELIYDRYNGSYSGIYLNGFWQNRLYFICNEIDEEKNTMISNQYSIDLRDKEVTEAKNGFVAVSEDYLITVENDTFILYKDDDTKIAAEGFEYEQYLSVYVINGKMFSNKRDYCFDTDTGKCRKVNIPKSTYVRAYLDGSYILWSFDFEVQKPIYSKVSEDELIGDEIS